MTSLANTWILGLDLGDRSRGAFCLADWLAGPEHTLAVHVLEMWSRPYIRTDAISAARDVAARQARELHLPPLTQVTVTDAESAEAGLVRVAEGAAGLVIGRAAGRNERLTWALGHVARRVLRVLPCPVVVVPHDLGVVAPGPIVVAVDLDDSSVPAVSFARALAAKQGRELVVAHVIEDRSSELIDAMDPFWLRARDLYREEREQSVHRWTAEHALIGPARIAHGSIVDELGKLAVATSTAMVVVGSRRLGTLGRIFLGSTASALAGLAPCPVAVVPSP